MKTALKMVGYIIGFLLMAAGLIAIVLYIMGLTNGEDDIITTLPPTESSTPAPDGSTTLEDERQDGSSSVTVGTPTPTITVTPFLSPTPTPSPSPTPSPTPTPVPDPAGTPLGAGKFSSETGVWIDVDALWSAETVDQNTAKVTVTANLRSFRLQTGGTRNGLEIKVGDQVTTMDVEALNVETEQEVTTELGTYSFNVSAPNGQITTLDLEVIWHFGGTYSGQQLDTVTAGGQISLSR